ncbi:flagellar hook-associated protein FlgK [Labrenzia sp. PHM005]|uniref:flagellar hook-associated protein FlgK n=1 Tax=Labrenzia sp. PHM005 TaxID=2590016 RepID=UPI00114084AA|nr:flagellar hook-associated protein FlgK [Labrenzia sp. PHM005]QDG76092.1 flagellar hook-associated protein FlgK [Labrenzia sp. PHM005]
MTSLSTALQIASGSLGATQVKLSVAANNIANADTKGFTAKQTSQSALVTSGFGSGLSIERVLSNVSKFLLDDLLSATTATVAAETQASYMDSLQKTFGAITGPNGESTSLASTIAKFEEALTKLAGTPESASLANSAVQALQDVTRQLQKFSIKVDDQILQADSQMDLGVKAANQAITEIHQINQQIRQAGASGQPSAEYEDKLNLALGKLSEQLGIKPFRAADGSVKVYSLSGQVLVDNSPHPLATSKDANGHTRVSANGADITGALNGGKLGGLAEVRDKMLPAYQETFHELAGNLISGLNAVRPNLLVGTNARDITVNSTVLNNPKSMLGTTQPAKVANALLDVMQKPTSFGAAGGIAAGNRTFSGYANEILSKAVSETNAEKAILASARLELDTVSGTIASMHGVNVNEETANLAQLKQLYSVSSTVLKIIQEMFQDLRAAVN